MNKLHYFAGIMYLCKSMKVIRFIIAVLLLSVCVSCSEKPFRCSAPAFLSPGDKIALISPSYNMPVESVDSVAAVIRSWGFEPVLGQSVEKLYLGHYAGSDEERLEDLRRALRDTSIKAIICNRGGYGSIHLVDLMTPEDFTAQPKWLVGYSDITTISGMEACAGVMSIHGAMGCSMLKNLGQDASCTLMRDLLLGNIPQYSVAPNPWNIPGEASGVLVGGNLSTFSPILGTWADPTAREGFILFIEEVEEDMTHIDRMINTLVCNGVFDRCKGVILGEFTDCGANLDYECVEQMICSYLDDYGIPVCCGFPAGHGDVNLPLVMGARVNLKVSESGSRICFDVDGITNKEYDAD